MEHPSEAAIYPASPGQHRMWFLHQYAPSSPAYCVPSAIRLTGTLHPASLEQAFRLLIQRHDTLRTTFLMEDGELRQRVARESEFRCQQMDLELVPADQQEAAMGARLDEEVGRPFDLSTGPALRALLIRLGPDRHVLFIAQHHIHTDGWSMGVLWRDLAQAYQACRAGETPTWSELPLQYADYAGWQRDRVRSQDLEEQLRFWKRSLADLPRLELRTDHPRPQTPSNQGAHVVLDLPPSMSTAVKALGGREGATLFMTLLAAFQVLLHRYTSQVDLAVGTPIAGRGRQNLESLIGFFVNTLVMRCRLSGDLTFRELLVQVRGTCLDAYSHQDLPFEKLVEDLSPSRAPGANPLFQVMFVLEAAAPSTFHFGGLEVEFVPVPVPGSKFDLTLTVTETASCLRTIWDYSTDLFESSTIERMSRNFETLLQSILANPNQPIGDATLLPPTQQHQLLVEWNTTTTDYPRNSLIHELFEKQALRSPEAVAVKFEEVALTYHVLNRRANQLAHVLRRRGVGPGTRVGVCIERSPEMILSVLAILKAGGAYVPLDPSYPQARLEFLVQDSLISLLVAQERWRATLEPLATRVMWLERDASELESESDSNPELEGTAEDLAYVSYTSGSSGLPKGVLVPHRGVVRLVRQTNYVSLGPQETILHASPLSFDASTFELWGALLNGGCVAILPPGPASLSEIADSLRQHQVTTLWLTAGLFHLMVEQQLDSLKPLRQLIAGGDVLSPDHVNRALRALPECRLINGYGPTENTTFTCCHLVTDQGDSTRSIPIGRPIANTLVYILDGRRRPVPVGVEGELYAGGDGVALGYLNQPDLTAERFLPDPFSLAPNARMYRTGDRARWLANGTIEFCGRLDQQVKIRGFRVEPGEIEAVLGGFPDLTACAVIPERDATGGHRLNAFVAVRRQANVTRESLRFWLAKRLPDYLIPSRFTVLDSLPLTPNGKVDRNALSHRPNPEPDEHSHQPPTDSLEQCLLDRWEKVLQRRNVGVHDSFFDLGGHSMLALRLFSELEALLGIKLPLATLFQAPTVAKLAEVLRHRGWTPPWQSLVTIQKEGARPPLFLIHGIGGNILGFRDLAVDLGSDQPVYGLQSSGLDGKSAILYRVEEMAALYLDEIVKVQPTGPYHLCGLSFGGVVAFELAQQLRRKGYQVGFLGLLDTHPPGYGELLPLPQRAWDRMRSWKTRFEDHLRDLSKQPDWGTYLQKKVTIVRRRLKSRIWQWKFRAYETRGSQLPGELRDVREANTLAARRYVTRPFAGKVTLLMAAEHQPSRKAALRRIWSQIALGGLEVHEVPGDHVTLIQPPHTRTLALQIRACLDAFSTPMERR